jgi:hypothetical protein
LTTALPACQRSHLHHDRTKRGPKSEKGKMHDDVRQATSPEQMLLEFFQSTYEAGATLAHWNRQELEQQPLNVEEIPQSAQRG